MVMQPPAQTGEPAAAPPAERAAWSIPGFVGLVFGWAAVVVGIGLLISAYTKSSGRGAGSVWGWLVLVAGAFLLAGLVQVVAGEARVVQLFGQYQGTVRAPGLAFVNPLTKRRKVASSYPYTSHREGELSLRDNADEITQRLSAELADRVRPAGVGIIESRLTRLSYAPEIAQAMLRQQQANAVVGARQRIVEGAVGMVELALQRLEEKGVIELDEERKAAMVSNLLVVLCSEQATQQVVNTGSLYQ